MYCVNVVQPEVNKYQYLQEKLQTTHYIICILHNYRSELLSLVLSVVQASNFKFKRINENA